jgi:hypothetical protein
MTDPMRPTDDAITAMLLERAQAPVPADLHRSVIGRVRDERARARRDRGRSARTGTLLLAAALTIAGVLGVAGVVGSRPQPAPSARPASPLPAAEAATPAASGVTPRAAQPASSCFSFSAERGGEGTGADPVPGPAPAEPTNGPVIILGGTTTSDPNLVDPFAVSPTLQPVADWQLASYSVNAWNPSLDGTVVAVELGEGECANDVFVMRTDGTGLRRPFAATDRGAFAPAWSPDGSRLALVTAPWSPGGAPANTPSSLLLWDPATGDVTDLGRPCDQCSPVGQQDGHGAMAWSPDSTGLAVDYTDLACGIELPAPDAATDCRGIAVVTRDGTWDPVRIDPAGLYSLVGWLDDETLLADGGGTLDRIDVASGERSGLPSSISAPMWSVSRALSPDRSMVLKSDGVQPYLEVQNVLTGDTTRLEPVPPDVLDFSWSPDSRWVLVQADTDGFGANRGLYLAPVDGSENARQVLPGAFGTMAWLQAPS